MVRSNGLAAWLATESGNVRVLEWVGRWAVASVEVKVAESEPAWELGWGESWAEEMEGELAFGLVEKLEATLAEMLVKAWVGELEAGKAVQSVAKLVKEWAEGKAKATAEVWASNWAQEWVAGMGVEKAEAWASNWAQQWAAEMEVEKAAEWAVPLVVE